MVRWVFGSIPHGGPIELLCSTTGVTRHVCVILSVGWCILKNPCCYSKRVAHVGVVVAFLFDYLSGPLPYVRRHVTVNVLSASLNTDFLLSF